MYKRMQFHVVIVGPDFIPGTHSFRMEKKKKKKKKKKEKLAN